MRTIPILSRREAEKPSSGVAEVFFATVTHPETSDVIRLVVDGVDYVLNGDTFHKSAFELDLLMDSDRPPSAPFRFPNVDRTAIAKLRLVNGPCRVSFEVYSSAYWDLTQDPRTVKPGLTPAPIYTARSLFLTEVSADDVAVSGTLRSWDYTQESWPNKLATKALTPGVYAR